MRQKRQHRLWALAALMALPLPALADQVVVADPNGNELTYTYDTADGPATFTAVKTYSADEAKAGHIVIADAVTDADGNTHPVLYIGGAVANRGSLRSIVFGQNIVAVGGADGQKDDAFYNCRELASVTLNAKLEILGRFAFQNCYYLRHINLGEATSLTTIRYSAFMDCDRLEPLTLPASVATLEERAFWGPDSLTAFTFAEGSQLTAIPANCFAYCASLQSLTLPDGVQTIGNGAFYACASLTDISFGTGLTELPNDYYLFASCNKLQKVTLPGATYPFVRDIWFPDYVQLYVHPDLVETYRTNSFTSRYHVIGLGEATSFDVTTTAGGQLQEKVEAIGTANNVLTLTVTGPLNGTDIDYIHASMPNIEVLNLTAARIVSGGDSYHQWDVSANGTATMNTYYGPWDTEDDVISRCMFYNMPTLRSLSLPAGATKIGDWACGQDRQRTYNLKHIDIPAGVTEIGRNAFEYTGIEEMTVPAGVTRLEQNTFAYCPNLKRVTLPDGITYIGSSCFSESQAIEDVNIPAQVETIEQYAFNNNKVRTAPIVLPATLKTIGYRAFANNNRVKQITFSEGLETIGQQAFASCTDLESLVLPESITTIGNSAFEYCDSITTFTFPASITTVPYGMFYHCDRLQSVTLNAATTRIDRYAFQQCPSLSELNFADLTALKSIGYYAFQNTGFTAVTLPDQITEIENDVFRDCHQLVSINVPTGIDYVPIAFVRGSEQFTTIAMHPGIRTVKSWAFENCPSLQTVELNDQITSIEERAFSDSKALQLTKLPDALTFVGQYAFYNTKGITTVLTIPEGVTRIDRNAFDGSGLTAVTLPDGLTTIGTGLFANTAALASVKLPSNITRIPDYTFQRATALKTVTLPETVREIGYAAFDLSGLEQITLPDSVLKIESYAFSSTQLQTFRVNDAFNTGLGTRAFENCKRLKTFYMGRNDNYSDYQDFTMFNGCDSLQLLRIYAGTPPRCNAYYMGYRTGCVLEVPEDQVELYQQTDVWKDFKEVRGFFMGDVLDELDYAVLRLLYRDLDGQNWQTPWDLTNDHHASGKWPGVTTVAATPGSQTYHITAIELPQQGLSGQLPDSLFLLSHLETLNLSNNRIRADLGTVVSGLAADTRAPLTDVNLSGNAFTGDLYPFAAAFPTLQTLNVSYNQLTAISEPIDKTTLTSDSRRLVTEMQFVDWETHKVVVTDDAPITDITPGIPVNIPFTSLFTYNHYNQDYSVAPSGLARIYRNGNSWGYDWELARTSDGLWDLGTNSDNLLRVKKGEVVAFSNLGSWWNWNTVLLRFDWQDGDVNADQTVDVADLQSVIYYALYNGKPSAQPFNFTTADANSDETINVSDVVGAVDRILAYDEPAEGRAYGSYEANRAYETNNRLALSAGGLTLTNTDEVAALQLTVSGASSRTLSISSDLRSLFSVAVRDIPGGVRLVVYSASGRTLAPGEHQLLTGLPAGATVTDARLVDADARHLGVALSGEATAVESVATQSQHTGQVYDLQGRPVGQWDTLPQGIYVITVNGKQVKVKK